MGQKTNPAWWQSGVKLFAQLSSWIVFPILAGIYLGQWLDQRYQTNSRYFYICVAVAFVITNAGIIIQGRKAYKEMPKTEQPQGIKETDLNKE